METNEVHPYRKYHEGNHMSRKALIEFYRDLLKKGTIEIDGAAHQRLKDLESSNLYIEKTKRTVSKYKRLRDMRARAEAKRLRDLEDK